MIENSIGENNIDLSIEKVYAFIINLQDYNTDIYHEGLYRLGELLFEKFEETSDNKDACEAIITLSSAYNSYLFKNNKVSDKYALAIQKTRDSYFKKNTKPIK
ncbi:MAG TPA: hypothetical protein DCO83_04645 [Mucilaginibacter sp.]|nr:hypothetical protein [Mucilaginibacter sp.]